MESPFKSFDSYAEPPRTVERRRRGRGVDVMAFPTPERAREHHAHFPTPVTEHRASKRAHALDMLAPPESQADQLPTPQTLPRKRKSHDSDGITPLSPPSPTGHTTFFLSQSMTAVEAAPEKEKVTPRRRPGLLFAQQMGLTSDSSTKTSTVKFGARLGVGVGMGGGMRGPSSGSADKVMLDNPFLDPSSRAHGIGPQTTITTKMPIILREPSTPDAQTSYVPQLLRPDAERSLSPTTAALRRKRRVSPPAVLVSSATIEETMAQRRAERLRKLEEDNPFIAKPGEVVRPRPTSEDRPLVTYVFRGAKKVFANPFIPPDAPYAPAQLDPSHPEYEVHPCPPPRLLWPTSEQGRARTISSSSSGSQDTPRASRARLDDDDDDDMDVDRGPLTDEEFVPEDEDDDGDSSDEEDLLPAPRRGLLFSSTPRAAAKHDLDVDETPVDGPAAHVKRRRLSRAEL